MKLQIVLSVGPGIGERVSWVEMDLSEDDLALPYEDFSRRFLQPAFHHLKQQHEGQKQKVDAR